MVVAEEGEDGGGVDESCSEEGEVELDHGLVVLGRGAEDDVREGGGGLDFGLGLGVGFGREGGGWGCWVGGGHCDGLL